jgi:Tol biopolymer transport system component
VGVVRAGTIQLLDGGASRLLAAGWCYDPTWSPDGQRIACGLEAKGITVTDVTGGNVQLLTSSPYDRLPLWVPNREAILFVRSDPQFKQYAIYLLSLTSRQEELLAAGIGPVRPTMAVSPDGARLTYPSSSGTGLEVMQLATHTRKDILAAYGTCFAEITHPQWSHDGRYLAFIANLKRPANAQVLLIDTVSAQVFQLTQFNGAIVGAIGPPSWSPDDTQIATSFGTNSQQLLSKVLTIPVAPLLQSPVECTK